MSKENLENKVEFMGQWVDPNIIANPHLREAILQKGNIDGEIKLTGKHTKHTDYTKQAYNKYAKVKIKKYKEYNDSPSRRMGMMGKYADPLDEKYKE